MITIVRHKFLKDEREEQKERERKKTGKLRSIFLRNPVLAGGGSGACGYLTFSKTHPPGYYVFIIYYRN